MSDLQLAKDLALPLDAVTRATAIVGQRGTGKTSTAVVFVEEAAAAGAHFAVIDPTGAWYGLTSNAKGTGPGLDCVVMGGHNGDVPLEPESGQLVARLVVEERYSVVLDLEKMTKGKQVQFVAQFCEELYHRNRSALTLVIDEAHRFAPQQLRDTERGGYGARCLGAVTDVATLGRRKGLGAVAISQRPAKIHKDVFEECEVVIAHRLMGTNDRKAIAGWLEEKDEEAKAEADAALSKLRKLRQGHALVYAPTMDVFGDFLIRRKRTFDSSATPEIGGEVVLPKKRSQIDLTALEQHMTATLEKQKAEDPRELRKRIAELEKERRDGTHEDLARTEETVQELKQALDEERARQKELEIVEVPLLDDDAQELLQSVGAVIGSSFDELVGKLEGVAASVQAAIAPAVEEQRRIRAAIEELKGVRLAPRPAARHSAPSRRAPARRAAPTSSNGDGHTSADGDFTPSGSQQRILDTLAWFETLGIDAPKRPALAPMAGTKTTSGGFKNNLGALRTARLIDYPEPNRVALLKPGRALAAVPDVPATAEALREAVLSSVTGSQAALLETLIRVYPDALSRDELAAAVGVPVTSGGFKNNLGALRTLELLDYPAHGEVAALPILFPTGAIA